MEKEEKNEQIDRSKEPFVSGLTLKVFVIAAILIFIETTWQNSQWWWWFFCTILLSRNLARGPPMGRNGTAGVHALLWMFVVCAIAGLVNRIARRPVFSRQEVVVLAVAAMIPPFMIWHYGDPFQYALVTPLSIAGYNWSSEVYDFMPAIFGPKDSDYWMNVLQNSLPLDWGAMGPTIAWFSIFMSAFALASAFGVLLFRRVWIDVEGLRFPLMEVAGEFVESSQLGSPLWRSKYFIGGFVIQCLWYVVVTFPHIWGGLTTGDPTLYMEDRAGYLWFPPNTRAAPIWGHQVASQAGLPWVPMYILLMPWYIGWGLILSLEVLVSSLIGWFSIWFAWPLLSYSMGGLGTWTAGGSVDATVNRLLFSAPTGGNIVSLLVGMLLGLGAVNIWSNRETLVPILKGLVREPDPEIDPERPIPYRILWIASIAFFLLAVAMAAVAEIRPVPFIIGYVVIFIALIGMWRMTAETGGVWGAIASYRDVYGHPAAFLLTIVLYYLIPGSVAGTRSTASAMTWMALLGNSTAAITSSALLNWFQNAGMGTLHGFKIGKTHRTTTRSILKTIVFAFVFTSIVGSVMTIWGFYQIPAFGNNLPNTTFRIWGARFRTAINRAETWDVPYDGVIMQTGDIAVKAIAGFGVSLLIFLLRGKFPWFRISVAGLCLGALNGWLLWPAFIIALIVKWYILKMGGVRRYRDMIRPLAIGLIAGYIFGQLGLIEWVHGLYQLSLIPRGLRA